MKKIWYISLLLILFVPYIINAQDDDFFNIKESGESQKEDESTLNINVEEFTALNSIALKVNNEMITSRDVQVFFALKQLSPFLIKAQDQEDVKKIMTSILGLEHYIKTNSYTQVIPTRTDIDKKIDFLNSNVGTKSVEDTIEKIDPSKTLTSNDLRRFFYYQALYEKGFIFLLQQQFFTKILSPREDELRVLYNELSRSTPSLFSSPSKISLMTILIQVSNQEEAREKAVDNLMSLKTNINKTKTFNAKLELFKNGIKNYSTSSMRTLKVIGPLDEDLVTQDFPEYKDLFLLEKGSVSNILESNGIMRMVFVVKKEQKKLKNIEDPQVKSRLTNIIYEKKAQVLFKNFLKQNLEDMKIE